jgi:hypothetical protein
MSWKKTKFLKSQLEAYQQELARAREAYGKDLNSYTASCLATLAEQTTENICKEYMCCQCGDIYYRAGYKIVQVPLPGTVPPPSPFEAKTEPAATREPAGSTKLKTKPAATQEPVGQIKTEPAVTQEPAGPSRIKKEVLPVANKAVKTVPMEEVTPPSQINLSTSREQSTQTLPNPTTSDAKTQTRPWDEHAEIQKWKKEYDETQAQHLQVHRQT